MKIINPNFTILSLPENNKILSTLEQYGRICYKSENKITMESAHKFINYIIKSGHHSVIEHAIITVHFICDRGISHELVRHRLASYSQESTRYVNYSNNKLGREITFIRPIFWLPNSKEYKLWLQAMYQAENTYLTLLASGAHPQEARSVLPHSLKTEIIMTANLRQWRHVLNLRSDKNAHPQIREIILPLLNELNQQIPIIFDDLYQVHRLNIKKLQKQLAIWNDINNNFSCI